MTLPPQPPPPRRQPDEVHAPVLRHHRGRRVLVALAVIVVLVIIAAVVLEVVARQQADAAAASAEKRLPAGSSVELDSSPLLWQIATGGVRAHVALDADGLQQLVRERTGLDDLTVTTGSQRITASLPVTVLGVSVPLAVTLRPAVHTGALELTVSRLTIGGLEVSGDDARSALQQVGGRASTLLDTQRIPDDGSVVVESATVSSSGAEIDVRVPLATVLNGGPSLG